VASLTQNKSKSTTKTFSQTRNSLAESLDGQVEEEPPDTLGMHKENSNWIYQPPKIYKIDDYVLPDIGVEEELPDKFEKPEKTTVNERVRFMLRLLPETNAKTYLHKKFKSGLFTSEEKSPWENYPKVG